MVYPLAILVGFLLEIVGWGGAFVLMALPPPRGWIWLLPVLALAGGLGLLRRHLPWLRAAVLTILAGLCGIQLGDQAEIADWAARQPLLYAVSPSAGLTLSTLELSPAQAQGHFWQPRQLLAAPGWRMRLVAQVEAIPGGLAWLGDGRLLVSLPGEGRIVQLALAPGGSSPPVAWAEGLATPGSLAVAGDRLLVAVRGAVVALPLGPSALSATPLPVVTGLPWGEGAAGYTLQRDGTDHLLIGVGAACGDCRETDGGRGALLRLDLRDLSVQPVATGFRRPRGIWRAPTGDLWVTDSARDWPIPPAPADELNRVRPGRDYGWPFCYGARVPDPSWGSSGRCRATQVPAVALPPESRPVGLAPLLLAGRPTLVIALAGDAARGVPARLVAWQTGESTTGGRLMPLLQPWHPQGRIWWQPVVLIAAGDRSLLVADAQNRAIYRVEAPTGGGK